MGHKNTKVKVFSDNASEEQWDELRSNIAVLTDEEFSAKYDFSKSGIRSYLNEHDGVESVKRKDTSKTKIVYERPSSEYKKVCIQVTEDTYKEFTNLINEYALETGLEKRYITDFLLKLSIKQCRDGQ